MSAAVETTAGDGLPPVLPGHIICVSRIDCRCSFGCLERGMEVPEFR